MMTILISNGILKESDVLIFVWCLNINVRRFAI